MPVTVCDSSTLIHLAGIGRLDLLRSFYGTVLIPPAVFREVVTEGGTRWPARMVAQAVSEGWIQIASDALPEAANLRQDGKLHAGEAEAIALLQARRSDGVLVMDEAYGRSEGRRRGLVVTGILGILLRAKREGLIVSLRVEMERLRRESGFFLHEELVQQILELAGETTHG